MLHIVFHVHRADVTDAVRQRAEQAVRKLAARLRGTTDASIRFAEDGAVRRVEIVLRAARRAPLVAEGTGTRYEFALAAALDRVEAHVAHVRALRERQRRPDDSLRATALRDAHDGLDDDADFGDLMFDDAAPSRRTAGA